MRAVILAGGDLRVTPLVRQLSRGELLIAADSGLRHAKKLGLPPDLIVGDFDSARPSDLAQYDGVPRKAHPSDKNELDLELAINEALAAGATDLRLLGALGSRLDQSLAALFIAARLKKEGIPVSLHGASQDVYLFSEGDKASLELPPGQLFSLLSLSETSCLTLTNARYPLDDFRLGFGLGLGVSNRLEYPPLKLSLKQGLLALIIER